LFLEGYDFCLHDCQFRFWIVWLNVGHICICRLINKKTNSTSRKVSCYEITRLRDYEITSDLECVWPESENNGTPGPDLISVSRSYFLSLKRSTRITFP
jgi:hypothetical protein